MTANKSDISTGFDIKLQANKVDAIKAISPSLSKIFDPIFGKGAGQTVTEVIVDGGWSDVCKQLDTQVKQRVDMAEEIFHEEAAKSHWSLNMADNSIDKYYSSTATANSLTVDARVGVNEKKIGDPSNWSSFVISRGKNKGSVGYFYRSKDYRMHPGKDYSDEANNPTERKIHYIDGFCERAEERFNQI